MATNVFSRQQRHLINRWYSPEEARKIAYVQQQRLWNLQLASFKLSEKWQWYSLLSPWERAIQRRAKTTWKPAYYYQYVDWKVSLKPNYKWV